MDLQFKVTSGSRYLGSYISSHAGRELWVREKVTFWLTVVIDPAFTTLSHP
jgi:hypothetical protein